MPRVFDDDVTIPTYLHVRGDPKNPDLDREITAGVPAILTSFAPPVESVPLPAFAYAPGVREYVRRDHLREAESEVRQAEQQLSDAKEQLKESPLASDVAGPSEVTEVAEATEAEPFEIVDTAGIKRRRPRA